MNIILFITLHYYMIEITFVLQPDENFIFFTAESPVPQNNV